MILPAAAEWLPQLGFCLFRLVECPLNSAAELRQVYCAVCALGQGGLTEMISAALQSSRSTNWHMRGGTVQ